jgi:hypothetical protein
MILILMGPGILISPRPHPRSEILAVEPCEDHESDKEGNQKHSAFLFAFHTRRIARMAQRSSPP